MKKNVVTLFFVFVVLVISSCSSKTYVLYFPEKIGSVDCNIELLIDSRKKNGVLYGDGYSQKFRLKKYNKICYLIEELDTIYTNKIAINEKNDSLFFSKDIIGYMLHWPTMEDKYFLHFKLKKSENVKNNK